MIANEENEASRAYAAVCATLGELEELLALAEERGWPRAQAHILGVIEELKERLSDIGERRQ